MCKQCASNVQPHWDIIVGNIGTVYHGDDKNEARDTFETYKAQSLTPGCRATLEEVTAMKNGVVISSFDPESDANCSDLAKAHGVYDTCDFALPIDWAVRAGKLMARNISGHVVWNYPPGNIFGEPFGLDDIGREAIDRIKRCGMGS